MESYNEKSCVYLRIHIMNIKYLKLSAYKALNVIEILPLVSISFLRLSNQR